MVTAVSVHSTCTARMLHEFFHDGSTPDYFRTQKDRIIGLLNTAKAHRIVNVFAFLIEGSQKQSAAQLEELGFTRVADYHDYKYPDTSKRLWLYSLDMNNYQPASQAPKPSANPFAPRVDNRTAPVAVAVPTVVHVVAHQFFGLTYNIAKHSSAIRRQFLHRLMLNSPEVWPRGRWVDIPLEVDRCPPFLRGRAVEVQLLGGRNFVGADAAILTWSLPPGVDGHIVRVRLL